jgi:hypothetical protein
MQVLLKVSHPQNTGQKICCLISVMIRAISVARRPNVYVNKLCPGQRVDVLEHKSCSYVGQSINERNATTYVKV